MKEGTAVKYTDQFGVQHSALCTNSWGNDLEAYRSSINLVYVNPDEGMTDPYGRQLLRETSVTHQSVQSAPGRFWSL
jgi:hypothetical protein